MPDSSHLVAAECRSVWTPTPSTLAVVAAFSMTRRLRGVDLAAVSVVNTRPSSIQTFAAAILSSIWAMRCLSNIATVVACSGTSRRLWVVLGSLITSGTALRQNPRDATLSLNRFSVGVMLRVDAATPVMRRRTTCVLDCAARRTRERDIHAAITRSVIGVRRVVGYYPCRRAGSNNTDENADRSQHDAAFARRERVGRWGLASVDRRRLLRARTRPVYNKRIPWARHRFPFAKQCDEQVDLLAAEVLAYSGSDHRWIAELDTWRTPALLPCCGISGGLSAHHRVGEVRLPSGPDREAGESRINRLLSGPPAAGFGNRFGNKTP